MKRSEINESSKWDLTLIYKNDKEWDNDFNSIKIDAISKYEKTIVKDINKLFDTYYDISRKLEKLYVYAHLMYDSETSNKKNEVRLKKIEKKYQEFGTLSSYIEPTILKYNIDDFEISKKYKKELEEIFRFKNHTLSIESETLLNKFANVLNGASETYKNLTDTDLKFGTIKVEGKDVELTKANYSIYIASKNRDIRISAWNALYAGYKGVINTISSTYKQHVECTVEMAKLRGYKNALQASLYNDNINVEVFNNLVNTVTKNLEPLYKYYDMKKKILKLDELHNYDLYVDLIEECDKKYDFEEAKKLVLDATSVLGSDYTKMLKTAFDERWVDIYPNDSKRGGAYSSGGYDTKPYLLLNYQGKLDNVSTLAHELGHSMHSYYSNSNNEYHESNYKIFVAEVASTVNELLLCEHLLNISNNKQEKLSILNRLLELFKSTIYRQTMFSIFEKTTHEMVENNEILTYEILSDKYYELNKKFFGPNVKLDEEVKYEWSRIPHFYYNFYVYKYATGLSAACKIVENIKKGEISGYKKFLTTGGSDYPLNELLIAGVDMTDPSVVESAINMFEETLNKFIQIYEIGE